MDSMEDGSGKQGLMGTIFSRVNKVLFVFKLFYFFFFASFGSLFPLISIYFKQMGMSAFQSGILVGIRPLVELFSCPLWTRLADRWRRGKIILLASLFCWIVFTLCLNFINPTPFGCLVLANTTKGVKMHRVVPPYKTFQETDLVVEAHKIHGYKMGQSPIALNADNLINVDKSAGALVVPIYASVVYTQDHINQTFAVLLILVIIGEFFSSPAITLADSVVQTYLEDTEGSATSYGKQRMYGSLGWGLAMFFVGIILDHSTRFANHPCQWPGTHEKNYAISFGFFTVLMLGAMATATKFTFEYDTGSEGMYLKVMKDKVKCKIMGGSTKNRSQLVNEDDETGDFRGDGGYGDMAEHKQTENIANNLDSNYQDPNADTRTFMEKLKAVLPHFARPRPAAFLFVAWFMGAGVGLVFTFLFWHLQEINGSPTLYGIASVINHGSEIFAYYFSGKLIKTIGHLKVLYLGLFGNIIRFLYISWISKPYYVLIFEFVQGLTHATAWAAICSYLTQVIPKENRPTAQGLLQVLHHSLGKGLGGIFGGLIISRFGSRVLFQTYGIACCFIFIGFLLLNYLLAEAVLPAGTTEAGKGDDLGGNEAEGDDPKEYVEESTYLSPHGIPFAPHNRNASSSRLNEEGQMRDGQQGYSQNVIAPGTGVRPTPAPDLFAPSTPNPYQPNYSNY